MEKMKATSREKNDHRLTEGKWYILLKYLLWVLELEKLFSSDLLNDPNKSVKWIDFYWNAFVQLRRMQEVIK